mmetsp:Transcript_33655/g.71535  ORF Transcript_33655/g.71535 Transcript_33655/m.71535 type:complete len:82 (+) Transcript_33655:1123-1368(+)
MRTSSSGHPGPLGASGRKRPAATVAAQRPASLRSQGLWPRERVPALAAGKKPLRELSLMLEEEVEEEEKEEEVHRGRQLGR